MREALLKRHTNMHPIQLCYTGENAAASRQPLQEASIIRISHSKCIPDASAAEEPWKGNIIGWWDGTNFSCGGTEADAALVFTAASPSVVKHHSSSPV